MVWGGPTGGTVEDVPSLDIRKLNRAELLKPERWSRWTWGQFPGLIAGADLYLSGNTLGLQYTLWPGRLQREVSVKVTLVETDCDFGGSRPWFVCPGPECGRRVAILYLVGEHFRCRRCQGLAYQSQYQTELSRMIRKAKRVRGRLGGTGDLTEPFPARPRGMHRRTYLRLVERGAAAEALVSELLGKRVERLAGAFNRRHSATGRKPQEEGAKAGAGEVPRARQPNRVGK